MLESHMIEIYSQTMIISWLDLVMAIILIDMTMANYHLDVL